MSEKKRIIIDIDSEVEVPEVIETPALPGEFSVYEIEQLQT